MNLKFPDDYEDSPLSVQESSGVDPRLWIGVCKPKICQLVRGIGWTPFTELPDNALIKSRAHINPNTARKLAAVLLAWADDVDHNLATAARKSRIKIPKA